MDWWVHVTKVPFVSGDMLAHGVLGFKQSKSLTLAAVRWDDSTTLE